MSSMGKAPQRGNTDAKQKSTTQAKDSEDAGTQGEGGGRLTLAKKQMAKAIENTEALSPKGVLGAGPELKANSVMPVSDVVVPLVEMPGSQALGRTYTIFLENMAPYNALLRDPNTSLIALKEAQLHLRGSVGHLAGKGNSIIMLIHDHIDLSDFVLRKLGALIKECLCEEDKNLSHAEAGKEVPEDSQSNDNDNGGNAMEE